MVTLTACSYLEEPVFLAELDRLLPAVVAFVKVGCDATELRQLVTLQLLGQCDIVEVVKCVNRRSQTLQNNIRRCKKRKYWTAKK